VQLILEDGRRDRGGRSRSLNLPRRLEVREVQGEQAFDLDVDPAELAAALAELTR
jgi:hypothetical protein